ncbi:hypothetical protein RUND412_007973 [Rhizina undulata]
MLVAHIITSNSLSSEIVTTLPGGDIDEPIGFKGDISTEERGIVFFEQRGLLHPKVYKYLGVSFSPTSGKDSGIWLYKASHVAKSVDSSVLAYQYDFWSQLASERTHSDDGYPLASEVDVVVPFCGVAL